MLPGMGEGRESIGHDHPGAAPEPAVGRVALVVTAVVVAAVHAALWWLYWVPAPKALWGDENRYLEAAERLLAGDPGWAPGLLWPPLYPRFLAGSLALAGGHLAGVLVVQTLLLACCAAVLHDLVRRLSGSATAALAAAALTVGYPPLASFAHYLWPEVLHLLLFLVVLWVLVARPGSTAWAALAGLALGLALLCKSLLLPFVPILLGAAALGPGLRVDPVVAPRLVLVAAVAASTVAPTVVGNLRRDGVLTVADSSTFNLWVALNEVSHRPFSSDVAHHAYQEFVRSAPTFAERNRVLRQRIRRLVAERGVLRVALGQLARQPFLLLDKDSYLTEQLPGGFAPSQRDGYVRAGPALAAAVRWACYASYGALLVAGPIGLACWRFPARRWLRLLLLFVGYNLALFLCLHAKTRYQVQLLPVLFLGASCSVAWLRLGRLAPARRLGPGAWVACLGAVALLLFLAFGGPLVPARYTLLP